MITKNNNDKGRYISWSQGYTTRKNSEMEPMSKFCEPASHMYKIPWNTLVHIQLVFPSARATLFKSPKQCHRHHHHCHHNHHCHLHHCHHSHHGDHQVGTAGTEGRPTTPHALNSFNSSTENSVEPYSRCPTKKTASSYVLKIRIFYE